MRTLTLICLAACGLAPALCAQQVPQSTPRPAPPSGPLLEKAPDFAQWVITNRSSKTPLVAKEGSASPSPTPAPARGEKPTPEASDYQTLVVKTKPTRYEQTVMTGGRKIVKWFLSDLQIVTEGDGNPLVSFAGGRGSTNYGRSDFLGFEWISAANYEGVQKVSGQDCLVFREPFKIEGKVVQSDPQLMSIACISVDSRLPVALQAGDEIRTYTFGQAPTAPLSPPPEIEAVAAQWRSTIKQAARPVAKP